MALVTCHGVAFGVRYIDLTWFRFLEWLASGAGKGQDNLCPFKENCGLGLGTTVPAGRPVNRVCSCMQVRGVPALQYFGGVVWKEVIDEFAASEYICSLGARAAIAQLDFCSTRS